MKAFWLDNWVEQMLPKSFLKAGDSTVDKGRMSSITYSTSKLCSLLAGMECLFNTAGKVHCFFGSPLLQSLQSVPFLHFLFSGFSTSFATNFVFLCMPFKCFLRFEVVFLADDSVLFPTHRVQRTLKFFTSPLMRTK